LIFADKRTKYYGGFSFQGENYTSMGLAPVSINITVRDSKFKNILQTYKFEVE